jgi:hypothetical protein
MKIRYKKSGISITTTLSSIPEKNADFTITDSRDTTRKSILRVGFDGKNVTVQILWSHFSDDVDIGFHWSEESKVLFVGAGSVSAVLNLDTMDIIDINYPVLFWQWKYINDHILELGELECRLYSTSGKFIGQTAVDPPYEYEMIDNAIEFTSIVVGKTRIDLSKEL